MKMKFAAFLLMALSRVILLPTGCVINTHSNVDVFADHLVTERLLDCALVRITQARYIKSRYNNMLKMNEVLYIVDGIVECAISESTLTRLPVGTPVRDVELVDDVVYTKKILEKMDAFDSLPVELKYAYGFFDETPPPDGVANTPAAGKIHSPSTHWLFSEFYNPDVPIEETDIVEAFRKRAFKAEQHSIGNRK